MDLDGHGAAGAAASYRPGQSYLGEDPLGVRQDVETPAVEPVAVALTAQAADVAGLVVGDRFELRIRSAPIPVILAATTPAVPGLDAGRAALVDSVGLSRLLAGRSAQLPWPSQLWVGGADAQGAAAVLTAEPWVSGVQTGARAGTEVGTTASVFWGAGFAAVVLCLLGVVGAQVAELRRRGPEVAVLRALGTQPGVQVRARLLEALLTWLPAGLFGVVAGWLVARLVVAPLARSAVSTQLDLALTPAFAWPGWVLLLATLVAGMTATLAVTLSRVAQQARSLGVETS